MLSRAVKSAFYAVSGPLMRINALIYKKLRIPSNRKIKLHLGPGQEKYIQGFINIDANIFTGKADLWADLRYPLPFNDNTVTAVYSHHMAEHLPNIQSHLKDVYRCLKPGGVYRLAVPSGDGAIKKFIEKDDSWFHDFPDNRDSIGGKLDNFILCRNEHLSILTASYLDELIDKAGFKSYMYCNPVNETEYEHLFEKCLETEFESDFEVPHTLVVEAIK